jgi:hypothetical protein
LNPDEQYDVIAGGKTKGNRLDKIIYSNRVGRRMVLLIVLFDILIGGLMLAMDKGEHVLLLLGVIVGLLVVTLLLVWVVLSLFARNNVAELRRTDSGLTVEMAHIFDRGTKRALPLPEPEDWSWKIYRHGRGSGRSSPVIRLRTGRRTLSLWPAGARVVDKDGLAELAPDVVREMTAAGALK